MPELDNETVDRIAQSIKEYFGVHPESMIVPPGRHARISPNFTSLDIKRKLFDDKIRMMCGGVSEYKTATETVEEYRRKGIQVSSDWNEFLMKASYGVPWRFRLLLNDGSAPIYGIVIARDESEAISRVMEKLYGVKEVLRNQGHYDFDPDRVDLQVGIASFERDVIWIGQM